MKNIVHVKINPNSIKNKFITFGGNTPTIQKWNSIREKYCYGIDFNAVHN